MNKPTCLVIGGLAIVAALSLSCATQGRHPDDAYQVRWNFDTLEGWPDDSSEGSPHSYRIDKGVLRMATRANSKDRVKVCTDRRYGIGTYTWRVYVPAMGLGDQASIGAFLYKDDKHEVDFEIGSGTAELRKRLNASPGQVACYCTTQGHPYSTSQFALKAEAWYTLAIDIREGAKGLDLTWFINGQVMKEIASTMALDTTFTIHCSLENLAFLGDHLPRQMNYGLFDWVEFSGPAGPLN